MKVLHKVFGGMVSLIGWLGVLVCVAALIGVWVFSQRMQVSIDQVAETVTAFTSRTRDRSVEAGGWVSESRSKLQVLQVRLRDDLAERGIEPAELRATEETLHGHVREIREWVTVAESTREFMTLLGEIIDSMGAMAGAEGQEEVGSALKSGLDEVREAAGVLDELGAVLDEVREHGDAADAGARVRPLLIRCSDSLARLEGHIEAFTRSFAKIEEAVERIRVEVHRRVLIGAAGATVLLVWQAVAQACLVGWGRRIRN